LLRLKVLKDEIRAPYFLALKVLLSLLPESAFLVVDVLGSVSYGKRV
jgi:hypothetical protein